MSLTSFIAQPDVKVKLEETFPFPRIRLEKRALIVVVPVWITPQSERSALNNFKLDWTEIAQGGVFAHPIVKCLNILKDGDASLFMRLETLS